MAKYTLSYFDVPASRGEECRLALVLAGIEFTDDRIPYPEWQKRKADMPYGSVPVLFCEGKPPLAQSNAILRFIANQAGFGPNDPWQRALHDAVMESAEDMRSKIWTTLRMGDSDEEKKAHRLALAEGPLLTWAAQMERQIQGPFAFGADITVADLKLFMLVNWVRSGVIDHLPTTCLDGSAKLLGVHRAVSEHPQVAAWRARFL